MMRGYGYGTYNNMMGGSWVGELIMIVFGLLVLVGIVLLIIWAIRSLSGGAHHEAGPQQPGMPMHPGMPPQPGPPGAAGHHEAVAIAKRRLASGEITKEQYDEIMKALGE